MFSGATLEINRKKILGKIFGATRRKKKTPLVGAAFALADADARTVTPSP
jgi:hypothetical protein